MQIGENGGGEEVILALLTILDVYSQMCLSSIYPYTHTHTHIRIHKTGQGVEERKEKGRADERKREREKVKENTREKRLSEQRGPVVSLVVVQITQPTVLAQVKFQTFGHHSEYGRGYEQVSVIALASVYLTWYRFMPMEPITLRGKNKMINWTLSK